MLPLEAVGRGLAIGGAAIGIYSLATGKQGFRTTTDKINAAATVISIGSGVVGTLLLISLPVPGVGEVAVTVVGVAIGATEPGLLAADLIAHHKAQIEHGAKATSSFLQRNPEIAPDVAAVAALVSHRGDIVAASEELESSLARHAATTLHSGERAYSAAVSVGGRVYRSTEREGRRVVHWADSFAGDLIP